MQPNNPIVGGVALRRPAIQSPNYAAGLSGWTINADGSAEFNNATFRGTIVEGTNPHIVIATDGTIKFYDAAGNLVMTLTGGTPFVQILTQAFTDLFLSSRKSGDTNDRFEIAGNGTMFWGNGTTSPDTFLTPGGGGSLDISGSAANTGDLTINSVSIGRGIPQTPTSSNANGSASTGTTEVRDSVLGNYVFTSIAGRRYAVFYRGALSASVADDVYDSNIRNGGASTPGTTSTLVATNRSLFHVVGGPGQQSVLATGTFVPGAGTQTLGLFTVRRSGTGVGTPVPDQLPRELYVLDVGAL